MANLTKFQLIFIGILILAIVAAIGLFALNKTSNTGIISNVTVWGTLPDATMQAFFQKPEVSKILETSKVKVTYVARTQTNFDNDVIQAIASGRGPDGIIISQDALLQYLDKIVRIPYSNYPERNFKNSFIQEAELFLTSKGVAALPFTIDPMVMYWNRTLLTNAGVSNPPTLWSQLYLPEGVISKINKVDENHNIVKTALALGTYNNVLHAKEILSLLMFQAGSPIVEKTSNGSLRNALASSNSTFEKNGSQAALTFYTQFVDPVKSIYSWNTALPLSRDAFTSGDLALYFGFASELKNINTRNPNLNFDVAPMPQSQSSSEKMTYGNVYGMAILKSSPNISGTAAAFMALSSDQVQGIWSNVSGFSPVTRSLLAAKPSDPFKSVFYTAALQSRGWLDPNRSITDGIFADMIGSVISGDKKPSEAVQTAGMNLSKAFNSVTSQL